MPMTVEKHRRNMIKQVNIENLLLLLSLSSLLVPVSAALGQTSMMTKVTTTTTTTIHTTTFTDDTGFTVKLPLGWTAVDVKNTENQQPREAPAIAASDYNLLELCPPGQSVVTENDPFLRKPGCRGYFDSIQVQRFVNLEKEKSFAPYYADSGVDPKAGLIVLNITADDIIEYTKDPTDILVQTRDVRINVTASSNETYWQVPGKLALFSTYDDKLKYIGLYFVVMDHYTNNTAGYRVTYSAPVGAEADPSLRGDPRGDPIPMYGIGLDNLPPAFEPIMQIMKSVSIQLEHEDNEIERQ